MRTKHSIKNIFMVIVSSTLLFLCGLVTRKFSLQVFDNRILGYAGTIETIFSWLHMAECGISSAISYRLYQALAQKDTEQVSLFMSCYQWLYRMVGIVIFGAGLLLIPFLPAVFTEENIVWSQVFVIYGIMLAGAASSYFLTFRRVLYLTTQREYVYRTIDTAVSVFNSFGKILVVLLLPLYWVYYLLPVLAGIIGNLILLLLYRKDYPQVYKKKVSYQQIRDLGILGETKHYFIRKISDTANRAIDNIVVARSMGVLTVTLIGNYTHISNNIGESIASMINAISGSAGNLIYDKSTGQKRKEEIFWGINRATLWTSLVVMVCLNSLLQPFIILWIGDRYLLAGSYVFLLGSYSFFNLNHQLMVAFREPQGHFDEDMWHYTAAAAINIIGSFALVGVMGITGVELCTVIAKVVIIAGNSYTVDRHFLPGCRAKYCALLAAIYLAGSAETTLLYKLAARSPATVVGFLLRTILVFVASAAINLPLLLVGRDAAYLREKMGMAAKKMSHILKK